MSAINPHINWDEVLPIAAASATMPESVADVPQPNAEGEFATSADGAKFMASFGIPQVPLSRPSDTRWPNPGKNPAINGKEWQKKATTDFAQIDAWAKKFPGCNFGSLAKAHDGSFYVLETDSTELNAKYEKETGRALDAQLVIESSAPDRNHRWYAQSPESLAELSNIGQEEARGFSLRWDNEQCVSPGSIHPNGKQYRVVYCSTLGPATQPVHDIRWLKEQKPSASPRTVPASGEKKRIPPGGHHEALLKELGSLIHRGYSKKAAETALMLWAQDWLENPGHGGPLRDHVRQMADSTDDWERGNPGASLESLAGHRLSFKAKPTAAASAAETFSERGVSPAGGTPAKTETETGVLKTNLISLSDIDAEIQEWLWTNRFPKDSLVNLSGDADKGKSLVLYDVMARLSTGAEMPDGSPNPFGGQSKKVILMFSEGSLKTTVKPRMMVMGANMSNVLALKSVSRKGETDPDKRQFSLEHDLNLLRKALQENPEVVFIGFDPITNYLGDNCNMNRSQDVRRVLTPLSELAEDCAVTIVAIIHFNKNRDMSAMHRTGGAAALVEVPRAAWCCLKDDEPEHKGGFVFVPIKNNLGKRVGGLRYRIEETFITIQGQQASEPHLIWGGPTDKTADDIMNAQNDPELKGIAKAKSWLLGVFTDDCARKSKVIIKVAKQRGITYDCLKKARVDLRMETKKIEWDFYVRRQQKISQPWIISTDLEEPSAPEQAENPDTEIKGAEVETVGTLDFATAEIHVDS